jgi:transcriptional regulator with GAF, ATPase, and Fis domain
MRDDGNDPMQPGKQSGGRRGKEETNMTVIDRRVREAFIELTDTLVTDFDIIDFLERLAGRCTELLSVAACGVLLADHHGVLNLIAASTERARLVELTQLQHSEGPCLDAYHTGRPVLRADLADTDPRWPAFAAAARAAGFAAVHALPMRLREQRIGALSLFSAQSGPMDADTVALAQALADAATIGIVHQRALARSELVAEQLQTALNSRIVIEQAKGFLAERLGSTVEDAFRVLRRYARDHNRKLTDVAADIVGARMDLIPPAAAAERPPLPDR